MNVLQVGKDWLPSREPTAKKCKDEEMEQFATIFDPI
jgi:hypothetical protein